MCFRPSEPWGVDPLGEFGYSGDDDLDEIVEFNYDKVGGHKGGNNDDEDAETYERDTL
jgi:hypothetical protein